MKVLLSSGCVSEFGMGDPSWDCRGTDCGITIRLQEYWTSRLLAREESLEHMSPAWFIHLNLWCGSGPGSALWWLSTAPPLSHTSHTLTAPSHHMSQTTRQLMSLEKCTRSDLLPYTQAHTQMGIWVWKLIRQVWTPTSSHTVLEMHADTGLWDELFHSLVFHFLSTHIHRQCI